MDDFQQQLAGVAGGQKAWQCGGDHHRVTQDDVFFSLSYSGVRPGDGHQPHGAVEIGDIKGNFGFAIRAYGDGP